MLIGHQLVMPPEGILITKATRARIGGYLNIVNGTAQRHTAKPEHILYAAERAESVMRKTALPSSQFVGATAVYFTAGPSSKAYGHSVAGTRAVLHRAADGWRLMEAKLVARQPLDKGSVDVTLTDDHKRAMAAMSLYRATGERVDD